MVSLALPGTKRISFVLMSHLFLAKKKKKKKSFRHNGTEILHGFGSFKNKKLRLYSKHDLFHVQTLEVKDLNE